jgi:hypothetical protein
LSYFPFAIGIVVVIVAVLVVVKLSRLQTVDFDVDRVRLMDMLNHWQGPPELVSLPPPRPVKYTGAAKGMFLLTALILAGMAGLALFVLVPQLEEQSQRETLLKQESAETRGIVLRTWINRGSKGSSSYHVAYQFTVGRAIYHGEARVSSSMFSRVAVNSPVILRYVPSRPEVSMMDGELHSPGWTVLFALLPFAAFAMIPFTVVKEKRLLESGQPVGAVVTRVAPVKGGKSVSYRFLDAAGNTITGSVTRSSDVPELGNTVTALYDPSKSRRSMLYPAKFVRLRNPFRP